MFYTSVGEGLLAIYRRYQVAKAGKDEWLQIYKGYFNRASATTSVRWQVARTVWASSCEPVILVHVCVAAQHAKGPSEGEYRSASVVIINYSLSQSHHCCHSSETVVPITVKRDDDGSTNRKLFFRKCLDSSERHDMNMNTHHHKSAAEDRWSSCFHQLVTMTMIEIQKYGFGEAVCMMLFQQ